MRILLRRWTIQVLVLKEDLEEEELDPEVVEVMEDLKEWDRRYKIQINLDSYYAEKKNNLSCDFIINISMIG